MNRQELAQKIIDTCLEMTRLGLNQGTAGNVSVRYKDGMLITPTGTPYELMKPENILGESIPAIHYMIACTGTDHIPCVPYATFGTHKLADYVREGIKESKAILLAHHGLITADKTLDKALSIAHEVEVIAQWYLKLLATGKPIPTLSKAQMEVVLEKFKSYGSWVEET